jgi:hypothetical protein
MQINLGNLKVNTVDKGFVSIGPSVQNAVRARQHQNQGFGDVRGDGVLQQIEGLVVDDRDIIDFVVKKIVVERAR